MIEIRWHGRGGQGAVTAAELLASAVVRAGMHAQAFPAFGAERRGAPILAFTRLDEKPIEIRYHVYEPDVVVVMDPLLAFTTKVDSGLKSDGTIVINTSRSIHEVSAKFAVKKVAVVDATSISVKHIGAPITNTSMLGALLKATPVVPIEEICKVVGERFGSKNVDALLEAYEKTEVIVR